MRSPLSRRALCLLAVASALLAPLAAGVSSAQAGGKHDAAVVPDDLIQAAKQDQKGVFNVLLSGDGSAKSAKLAGKIAHMLDKGDDAKALGSQLRAQFSSVDALELNLSGKDLLKLAKEKGILSIVPNADVTPEKWGNSQKWDDAVKVNWFWGSPYAKATAPTIAIVDSGVDNSNGQFGTRLLGQFDLGGGSPQGDSRGHGTFVAALAAGGGVYTGVSPTSNIVSLDVFDSQGRGTASSVISAADWILAHRAEYNIRVANFSLQTSQSSSFMYDPLDQAVERLWQSGIVVTAAAGNYAVDGKPSGVLYAPANDPFVITVGAVDIHGSADTRDDLNSPWSAYGYTNDGFAKPELGAPGRYLIAEVPGASTIFADYPANVIKADTIQLSGTSFAAPIVAGMAANLLGTHPAWTPDQVKGVLMGSAIPLGKAAVNSVGVGEVNLQKAFELKETPNPNLALNQFLVPDPNGSGLLVFDGANWMQAAQNSASWNSASWNSASWNSASWNSASWNSASWNSASWNSASWNSASWNSASWNSVANNASGDGRGDG
jgi:serine protease AprX